MSTLTLLPLDLTGKALTNRINGEAHTLIKVPGRNDRLLMPTHGGFFAENFMLFDANGTVLKRGTDYKLTYLYSELTTLTAKEVWGMVVVTNPNVTERVSLNYRSVGGLFSLSVGEVKAFLETIADENQAVVWEEIIALPREYNPEDHTHEFWQLYACDSTVASIKRVGVAYTAGGDTATLAAAEAYGKELSDELDTLTDRFAQDAQAHYTNTSNPHKTTKKQVDLDQVFNWPMATPEEGRDAQNVSRYTSPANVYDILALQAIPDLQKHLTDYGKPVRGSATHGETTEQIGAYTYEVSAEKMTTLLPVDGMAADSTLLGGNTYAQLSTAVRSTIPAENIVTGTFPTNVLGTGVTSATKVLLGNGTWVEAKTLFDQYGNYSSTVIGLTYYGSEADAVNYLNTTYASIKDYPVGSCALYRLRDTFYTGIGNAGQLTTQYYQMHMAIRYADGWRQVV